jgi:hypothetical protein
MMREYVAATDEAPPFATIAKISDFDAAKIALFLLDPHSKMPDMGLSWYVVLFNEPQPEAPGI